MVNLHTLRYTRLLKNKWLACASLNSLQDLLEVDTFTLNYLKGHLRYDVFKIPKKNGDFRAIENPEETLKQLQRKINNYLQAVYYFYRHPASYGFCMNVKKDNAPCNIYTHALQHTGCSYLINADLKDFFYSVTTQKITELFINQPFTHNSEMIEWLCHVTTYNGRLPMGSPASPVLSNFAATKFDVAMQAVALRYQYKYTRYVDDMSFSSTVPYPPGFKDDILQTITEHGFTVNMQKVKEFGKQQVKIITGLRVTDKVSLDAGYWQKVDMLLKQFTALKCMMQNKPSIALYNRLAEVEEALNGFIAFAQMMGPAELDRVLQTKSKIENIDEELEAFESLAWNEIPYQF